MENRAVLLLLALWCLPLPSPGAGPLDGQISLTWWANDFDTDLGNGSIDAGAFGGRAQLWLNQTWGLKGAIHRSDLADSAGADDIDYLSIDLQRRLISATEHNFIAVGAGYENLGLSDGDDAQGFRLLLEGRVGIAGTVYAYGHTAWMPVFEDTTSREDLAALEFEAGIGFSPLPFVTLGAGWRKFTLDFTDSATGSGREATASGPVFEAGLKW